MTIQKYAGEPGDDKIPEFLYGAQFYIVGKTTKSVSMQLLIGAHKAVINPNVYAEIIQM
jgi:hypothetical protein